MLALMNITTVSFSFLMVLLMTEVYVNELITKSETVKSYSVIICSIKGTL